MKPLIPLKLLCEDAWIEVILHIDSSVDILSLAHTNKLFRQVLQSNAELKQKWSEARLLVIFHLVSKYIDESEVLKLRLLSHGIKSAVGFRSRLQPMSISLLSLDHLRSLESLEAPLLRNVTIYLDGLSTEIRPGNLFKALEKRKPMLKSIHIWSNNTSTPFWTLKEFLEFINMPCLEHLYLLVNIFCGNSPPEFHFLNNLKSLKSLNLNLMGKYSSTFTLNGNNEQGKVFGDNLVKTVGEKLGLPNYDEFFKHGIWNTTKFGGSNS